MGLSPFQAGALGSWRPGPGPSFIFESRLPLTSPTQLPGFMSSSRNSCDPPLDYYYWIR